MKSNNKHLLFTFDYELYLGHNSGSVAKCLIEPTNALFNVLEKYGCKGILFVDTTYLLRLKTINNTASQHDYAAICAQLQFLHRNGWEIHIHLHPHWNEATYNANTNTWQLINYTNYRLHTLNISTVNALVQQSQQLLSDILQVTITQFDCYRAGGWSIQPFEFLIDTFKRNNIKYDFSCLNNHVNLNEDFYYDYSAVVEQHIYRFEDDISAINKNGSFVELSISAWKNPSNQWFKLKRKLVNKVLWKLGYTTWGDGQAAKTPYNNTEIVTNNYEMVSVELLTINNLKCYCKFVRNNNYMQFISHSKMINKHSLAMLNLFLKYVSNNYTINTNFRKISEIND